MALDSAIRLHRTQNHATWRKSSFLGCGGNSGGGCVEVASFTDGTIAFRDSKHPGAGIVVFTLAEIDLLDQGLQSGKFDNINAT